MGGAAQAQVLANSQYTAPVQVGVPTHPSYTVEPFAPPASIAIKGTGVRLRAEPFATKETPVLSSGSSGLALNVVGIVRMSDWNWYQVVLKSGQKAFIRSDLTSAPSRGGGAAAPVAQLAPVTPSAPVIRPAPVQLPAPVPVVQPAPAYKPATAAPAPALPPAQSPFDNTAISLTPKSPLPAASDPNWSESPARASDPSGLVSVPPAQ